MYSFAITIFERVNFKYIIYGEKKSLYLRKRKYVQNIMI